MLFYSYQQTALVDELDIFIIFDNGLEFIGERIDKFVYISFVI